MQVIILSDPGTGEPLAVIKNVGPEEDWEQIDKQFDGLLFSEAVPVNETPTEFLENFLKEHPFWREDK